MKILLSILATGVTATALLAHDGVKDAQVMARMNLMGMIADDMKILGGIAKGTTEFSADQVAELSEKLAEHARGIIPLFEVQATDPKSEAREEIWTDWPGFTDAASEMEAAALALGISTDLDGFQAAFGTLGKTCGACHKDYRIKKD